MKNNLDYDTMEYREQYLIAYILIHPEFISLFDIDIVSNQDYHSILKLIKEYSPKEHILPSQLSGWLNLNDHGQRFLRSTIDNLFELTEKFSSLGEYIIKKDILCIVKTLEDRDNRNDICLKLEKSIQLVRSDRVEEGINLLKSINYGNKNEIYNGMMAIIESCRSSNPTIPTGIKKLDNITGGFTRGNLVHFIGDSGSMKTMITFWLLISILKANPNLTGVYFEKEMPIKDISLRMLAYELQVNLDILVKTKDLNNYVDIFKNKLSQDKELENLYNRLHVVSFESFNDAYDMRVIIEEYNPDIWILDFFTMLDNKKGKEESSFAKQQGEVLKNTANYTNSVGIVLSQTKQNTVEERKNKIPRKSDAEYGFKINQLCQMNLATFYPSNYYDDNYFGLKSSYYYLIPLKSRISGQNKIGPICLEAFPAQCFYNEANNIKEKEMLEWLRIYKTRKEDYK